MLYLTNDNIASACEQADDFLRKNGADTKEIIRLRITLEETLLRFQEQLSPETKFSLKLGKRFGNFKICLNVPGAMADPFANNESMNNDEDYLRKALVRMGKLPIWRYSHGQNVVLITLSKKRLPQWIKIFASIVAALLFGLLIRQFPDSVRIPIQEDFVAPLTDTYLGFLNAIAAPMIFFSVVLGIYSIGDAATFSVLGKKLVERYLFHLCLLVGLTFAMSFPLISINMGDSQVKGLSVLFDMILDIVPKNLFTPFSSGNTLQILFIATVVGISMINISEKVTYVAALAEQLGNIVNNIMGFIGNLVPLFIFGSLFNIVASGETAVLRNAGIFFFGTLITCFFILAFHTVITCIRMNYSPLDLWKKAFSTFVIGLTTASSSAALADDLKTCTGKFKISPKLANFAVPFGQIVFKPSNAVMYYFAAMSVAKNADISISLSWLITLLIMCIVLSSSTPPVTGGSTASFSILFVQLGLPLESLSVILAINAILNYFRTATSLFSQQCVLLSTAKKLDMIEKELEPGKQG